MSTPHRSALAELVFLEQPLAHVQQQLQEFPYDYTGNSVVLTNIHLTSALQRCIKGKITTQDLENWAELLVGRPGIALETGSESKLEAVLFQISTPEINAPHVLAAAQGAPIAVKMWRPGAYPRPEDAGKASSSQ
jgi:hypothetical protein